VGKREYIGEAVLSYFFIWGGRPVFNIKECAVSFPERFFF